MIDPNGISEYCVSRIAQTVHLKASLQKIFSYVQWPISRSAASDENFARVRNHDPTGMAYKGGRCVGVGGPRPLAEKFSAHKIGSL